MTDKEYYNYVCSLSNHLPDDMSKREIAKLEKVIRKIDNRMQEVSQNRHNTLFVNYSIIDYIKDKLNRYQSIFIPKKYKRFLECTLYKRLKNGGFEINNNESYTTIIWEIERRN